MKTADAGNRGNSGEISLRTGKANQGNSGPVLFETGPASSGEGGERLLRFDLYHVSCKVSHFLYPLTQFYF